MQVHVAELTLIQKTAAGSIKRRVEMTIEEALTASTEIRLIDDSDIPNTSGYPTLRGYLELEAADNFQLTHLDQSYVITYNTT